MKPIIIITILNTKNEKKKQQPTLSDLRKKRRKKIKIIKKLQKKIRDMSSIGCFSFFFFNRKLFYIELAVFCFVANPKKYYYWSKTLSFHIGIYI